MTDSEPVALHAVVHGRVQGVNFRRFVHERARLLRLTGYARNLPDGAVEVVAEGPRGDLEQFLEYLPHGPQLAEVRAVDVEWREATAAYDRFRVW